MRRILGKRSEVVPIIRVVEAVEVPGVTDEEPKLQDPPVSEGCQRMGTDSLGGFRIRRDKVN